MFEKQFITNPLSEGKNVSTYILISGSLNELFNEPRIRKEELLKKVIQNVLSENK